MTEDDRWREENTARLLRAAFDRSARPDRDVRARTLDDLLVRGGHTRAMSSFPDRALCLMAAGVVLLGVALAARAVDSPVTAEWLVATLVVGCNVVMAPVAAVIVVWNLGDGRARRSHA
jgi:hypothetical protein